MAKTFKPRAELEALINAELRQYEVCEGISVRVESIADESVEYTWGVHTIRGSGTEVLPECVVVVAGLVRLFQDKYDLAPEG